LGIEPLGDEATCGLANGHASPEYLGVHTVSSVLKSVLTGGQNGYRQLTDVATMFANLPLLWSKQTPVFDHLKECVCIHKLNIPTTTVNMKFVSMDLRNQSSSQFHYKTTLGGAMKNAMLSPRQTFLSR
jgi:hypothetical protein